MEDILPRDLAEVVVKSWERCINMDLPRSLKKPRIVINKEELNKRLKKNKLLIEEFEDNLILIDNFIPPNYLFMLIDSDGILLDIYLNKELKDILDKVNFKLGMSCSEKSFGTNAVSLAMELESSVFLESHMHYCYIFDKWYCFAIPIKIKEHIKGYINISSVQCYLKKELVAITKLLCWQLKKIQTINDINLSKKQTNILKLLASGLTEYAVAEEMGVSRSTIKYHKSEIYDKFRVNSLCEAIVVGLKSGVISLKDL